MQQDSKTSRPAASPTASGPERNGPEQRSSEDRRTALAARGRGEQALKEFEAACVGQSQSKACERFLAPKTCGANNPFNDNPGQIGSCAYLLSVHPCRADTGSAACRQFLENPCFTRPDGPSCFRFVGRAFPAGCSFDKPTVSVECQIQVAALLDLCETGSPNCDAPFGGSQEVLAFVRASEEEQGGGRGGGASRLGGAASPLGGLELASVEPGEAPRRTRRRARAAAPLPRTGQDLAAVSLLGACLMMLGLALRPRSRPKAVGFASVEPAGAALRTGPVTRSAASPKSGRGLSATGLLPAFVLALGLVVQLHRSLRARSDGRR